VNCPANPPAPLGFGVWKGPVPTVLTQWAMGLRDHINEGFEFGTTWTMPYNGQTVLARKDRHTFTWKNGVLLTGICISGITLYSQLTGPQPAIVADVDPLANPDGTEAVWSSPPPEHTDWKIVAETAGVIAAVILATWAAVHFAGRPGR
jgi:hypothetical protein